MKEILSNTNSVFIAQGFIQKEAINYQGVFAPVANLESIWIIVALAAKYDLELNQMDITTAYLNGELEEELYMFLPGGIQLSQDPADNWNTHCMDSSKWVEPGTKH
jgi:hypothetical protein